MNAREASSFLKGKIPEGRGGEIASFSEGEFDWLQRNKPKWFGSGRKNKKSQLRSFQPIAHPGLTPEQLRLQQEQKMRQAEAQPAGGGPPPVVGALGSQAQGGAMSPVLKHGVGGAAAMFGGGGGPAGMVGSATPAGTTVSPSPPPIVPPIVPGGGAPNIPNPLADQGSTTQTFAGPSSRTRLDDPVENLQGKVMTRAGEIMDRPYEAYDPTKRFEGPSADTTQSFADVRAMQGTGQTAFGEAAGVGKDVSGYTPEQVQQQSFLGGKGVDQYMSPHTQNVIGGMQENAMRTMQKQRGALQAQHQMAGAGVGSRGALENAAMMGEVQRGLGQQVAGALEGSYAQAAGMKKSDMERAQQAERYNQQAGLAGQDVRLRGAGMQVAGTEAGRRAAGEDIDLLGRSGAAQEGYGQRDKDFAYDQFLEGRDWDKENLMLASNVLGGAPSGATTTSSRPMSRKKDRFGRALAGAGAGAAFGPWGAAGGAAIGFLS